MHKFLGVIKKNRLGIHVESYNVWSITNQVDKHIAIDFSPNRALEREGTLHLHSNRDKKYLK